MVHSESIIKLLISSNKALIQFTAGLAHHLKHVIIDMLGRNLKLTADMMLNKLSEKRIVLILKEIIVSDTRTDKHLFNAR